MVSNNELKEIHTKFCTCSYLDVIINVNNLDLDNILLNEEHMKCFSSWMLHTKLYTVQNLYILFLIK